MGVFVLNKDVMWIKYNHKGGKEATVLEMNLKEM